MGKGPVGARSMHQRCVGCDEINSAWSPEGRLCPAHRHRPEQPAPQWVGAVAALERDDRAAVSERVPHSLPERRGNKTARAVQAGRAGFHTPRIDASALPPRSGTPRACYRKPSRAIAHVTADLRPLVRCTVFDAITGSLTRYRARIGPLCFRYRSASLAIVLHAVRDRDETFPLTMLRPVRNAPRSSAYGGRRTWAGDCAAASARESHAPKSNSARGTGHPSALFRDAIRLTD